MSSTKSMNIFPLSWLSSTLDPLWNTIHQKTKFDSGYPRGLRTTGKCILINNTFCPCPASHGIFEETVLELTWSLWVWKEKHLELLCNCIQYSYILYSKSMRYMYFPCYAWSNSIPLKRRKSLFSQLISGRQDPN